MEQAYREALILFCVLAAADIEGVPIAAVDEDKFRNMSDEELEKEADWLDYLFGK